VSEVSLRRVFTQDDFDRFAALSGDDNPIHVDPAFSARTRFGRTVAHGVLLITVLTGLVEKLRPGGVIAAQDVRFPAPTFAEEEMEFQAWEEGEQIAFVVTRTADRVTTCDGSFSLPPPPQWRKGRDGGASTSEGEGLTGVFSQMDVDTLISLGGASQPDASVPIPLLGALFSHILGTKLPGPGTNYLKQQTRYLAPAAVGEQLTAHVAVTRKRPDKRLIDLSTTCRSASGSLICEGRALVHAGDVAGAFD
jgi:acyl dehydratase